MQLVIKLSNAFFTKFFVLRIFGILIAMLISLFAIGQNASASIYAGSNSGWLVVSSHADEQVAINKANQYARNNPGTVVFQSSNGYYAVSLGWLGNRQGKSIVADLKSRGKIPHDSYIHNGKRWSRAIWSARNQHLSARAGFIAASRFAASPSVVKPPAPRSPASSQVTAVAPTAALVGGLKRSGDGYLSLRQGPGTSYGEIVRMRKGTSLTITGKVKSWYRVKLSNGMNGFAYSKYVKIREIEVVGPDPTPEKEVAVIGPEPTPEPEPAPEKEPDTKVVTTPEPEKPKITKAPPSDQKRVALVLGNSKYENTSALANPKNDADAIGTKLESLGFTVIKGLDLTKSGMEKSIRSFVKELPGADVALFFYAGHAMQVDGTNYLIPIDAALEDSTAIDFETINFSVILNFMNDTNRTSIALLDACRNNPLARNFTRKLGKSRSAFVGRGLAAPSAGAGQLLIGFATSPGEVALDGEGENSPFTTALLKHIETPGLEIELMLKRVKADVFDETEGTQSPWNNSALRKEFYFTK